MLFRAYTFAAAFSLGAFVLSFPFSFFPPSMFLPASVANAANIGVITLVMLALLLSVAMWIGVLAYILATCRNRDPGVTIAYFLFVIATSLLSPYIFYFIMRSEIRNRPPPFS